jgi:hypothetical protein
MTTQVNVKPPIVLKTTRFVEIVHFEYLFSSFADKLDIRVDVIVTY